MSGGPKYSLRAVAAGGKAMMQGHLIPKEHGGLAVGLVARVNVAHQLADHLGHQRVAVFSGEDVFALGERLDD